MSIDPRINQLAQELEQRLPQEARLQVPPFGAESIQLAQQLGSACTDLLLKHVESNEATALLALEALREADPAAYRSLSTPKRAEIYVDSFRNSLFFNAWGVPGYQLTPTAYALISLGEAALSRLRPLLQDKRPAPLSGSQDATTSQIYGNRICDYAWILISEIRQETYKYFKEPTERDRQIAEQLQDLQRGGLPGDISPGD